MTGRNLAYGQRRAWRYATPMRVHSAWSVVKAEDRTTSWFADSATRRSSTTGRRANMAKQYDPWLVGRPVRPPIQAPAHEPGQTERICAARARHQAPSSGSSGYRLLLHCYSVMVL